MDEEDADDVAEPLILRRSRTRREAASTSAGADAGDSSSEQEAEDSSSEREDEGSSSEAEAEAAPAGPEVEVTSEEPASTQPPPQTLASPIQATPVRPPRVLATKRKTWGGDSDDNEE